MGTDGDRYENVGTIKSETIEKHFVYEVWYWHFNQITLSSYTPTCFVIPTCVLVHYILSDLES